MFCDFYYPVTIQHPKAELISVEGARAVYKLRRDEISAARLTEDISRKAPIKEVGLQEAKVDDIIRTAYHQGGERRAGDIKKTCCLSRYTSPETDFESEK